MCIRDRSEYILEVRDLKQYFPVRTGWFGTTPLKAVDGVSFGIRPGETRGLVGESGDVYKRQGQARDRAAIRAAHL